MIGFRDKHRGEEIIVIGNGPGLKNIPLAFLESRTNIVLNFFPLWMPFVHVNYWMACDPEVMDILERLPKALPKFAPKYLENKLRQDNRLDGINIFDFDKPFHTFTTSIVPACRLAAYMGASTVLVVGFDCTWATPKDVDDMGRSKIPHFYHDNVGMAHQAWCEQMQVFSDWAWVNGIQLWNLSIPTKCGSLPTLHYSQFWKEPDRLYEITKRGFDAS